MSIDLSLLFQTDIVDVENFEFSYDGNSLLILTTTNLQHLRCENILELCPKDWQWLWKEKRAEHFNLAYHTVNYPFDPTGDKTKSYHYKDFILYTINNSCHWFNPTTQQKGSLDYIFENMALNKRKGLVALYKHGKLSIYKLLVYDEGKKLIYPSEQEIKGHHYAFIEKEADLTLDEIEKEELQVFDKFNCVNNARKAQELMVQAVDSCINNISDTDLSLTLTESITPMKTRLDSLVSEETALVQKMEKIDQMKTSVREKEKLAKLQAEKERLEKEQAIRLQKQKEAEEVGLKVITMQEWDQLMLRLSKVEFEMFEELD